MSHLHTARAQRFKCYIGDSPIGKGVFAARDLAEGETIFQLNGQIITFEEVVTRGEKGPNAIQIGPDAYVDPGSPGVFLNHSCTPNAGLRDDIILVAIRNVRKHEEIRFDYSSCMSEGCWTMDCLCREPECRGKIRDFHELPFPLKIRYLALDMVQRFIVRECEEILTPEEWEQVRMARALRSQARSPYVSATETRSTAAPDEVRSDANDDENDTRILPAGFVSG